MNTQFSKQASENKERISAAFEEIPNTIIKAQEMRTHFPEDAELERNSINLYKILLGAIADLVGCLLHQSECR